MIQEASLVGLARTLFIIIAVYWGFKLFSRYVLPWVLKKIMEYVGRKAQENMNSQGFSNYKEEPVKGNEKVSIKKTNPKPASKTSKQSSKDDLGEYVDFEEIK